MYTRAQFLSKEIDFQTYYEQWAFAISPLVSYVIGKDRILASSDPNFNDIPLQEWDKLTVLVKQRIGTDIAKANGSGGVSQSDCVCAAKAAAFRLREAASAK